MISTRKLCLGLLGLSVLACGHGQHAAMTSESGMVPASGMAEPRGTLLDIAAASENFDTLMIALNAAGMTAMLRGSQPYTLFAPTDQAFEKLPPGTMQSLLEPENKVQLRELLNYHLVPGSFEVEDIAELSAARTVSGQDLSIATLGDDVMIDNARIVRPNVAASNGMIHVIDTVLLPK